MSEEETYLVRFDLGEAGRHRVVESLSAGLQLGAQLAAEFERGTGDAFTFAPSGSDGARLLRWDQGGLLAAPDGMQHLAHHLQNRLMEPMRLLVIENAMAHRTDPVLSANGGRRFFVGDEVYEYVGPGADVTQIEECPLRADAGYSLNGLLAVAPRLPRVAEDHHFLTTLRPELLITRAYDGEGFVLLDRTA